MQKRFTSIVSTLVVLGLFSANGCGKLKVNKDGNLVLEPEATPTPTAIPNNGSNPSGNSGTPGVVAPGGAVGPSGALVGEGTNDILFECTFSNRIREVNLNSLDVYENIFDTRYYDKATCTPAYVPPAADAYKPIRTLESVTSTRPPNLDLSFKVELQPNLLRYRNAAEYPFELNQEVFGKNLSDGFKEGVSKGSGDKCSGLEFRIYAAAGGTDVAAVTAREVRIGWERKPTDNGGVKWSPLKNESLPDLKSIFLAQKPLISAFLHCKW